MSKGMKMEDTENYSSLQEFTEDISSRGNKPILYPSQSRQGAIKGVECMRRHKVIILLLTLLVSLCANIALTVCLVNSRSSSSSIAITASNPESDPQFLKLSALQDRFSLLCSDYTNLGKTCSKQVKKCMPCPEGWRNLEYKCYYFSDDKLDWKHSRDSCASMGSHLTILHTHEQHDALEKIARSIGGFDYHFWIGLSDAEEEGVWKWVDNTAVNKTYWSEWDSEPNNHKSAGLHGEDCAVLDAHSRTWFDVPCNHIYKRICEMNSITVD